MGLQLMPILHEMICTGCGDCVVACQTKALEMAQGKPVLTMPDLCDYCGECEAACNVGAIQCPYEILCEERKNDD